MSVPQLDLKSYDPTNDFAGLQNSLRNGGYNANPNLNPQLNAAMRGMALSTAMNRGKSFDVGLSGLEQQLEQQMKMDELKNKEAGPLDWAAGGVGGLGALNSVFNRRNLQNGGQSQGLLDNLFGSGQSSNSGLYGPGF